MSPAEAAGAKANIPRQSAAIAKAFFIGFPRGWLSAAGVAVVGDRARDDCSERNSGRHFIARGAQFSDERSGRHLGGGAMGGVPGADVVRDHQRRLHQAMADRAVLERPLDVAGAGHAETSALLLDNVEERGGGRPDDLDAAVLHAPVDMQMAAGNHRHAIAHARFEQPLSRRRRHGHGGEGLVVGIVLERRQMLEQHDRPSGIAPPASAPETRLADALPPRRCRAAPCRCRRAARPPRRDTICWRRSGAASGPCVRH